MLLTLAEIGGMLKLYHKLGVCLEGHVPLCSCLLVCSAVSTDTVQLPVTAGACAHVYKQSSTLYKHHSQTMPC